MTDLKGQPAEVRMTITVKRAATGLEETMELVGRVDSEPKEIENGNDTFDSSPRRGD